MHYEEKLINGVLCCRSDPDGGWLAVRSARANAVNALMRMSEKKRLEVMNFFCGHCGIAQPEGQPCQCWNDE